MNNGHTVYKNTFVYHKYGNLLARMFRHTAAANAIPLYSHEKKCVRQYNRYVTHIHTAISIKFRLGLSMAHNVIIFKLMSYIKPISATGKCNNFKKFQLNNVW